jgi:CDP-diacylglycerol---serine O-phosphatidyltransferase
VIRRPILPRRRTRRVRAVGARPRTLSFNRLLPNVLTVAALCAGLTAIRFAIGGEWGPAVLSIVVAGVLDGLDGTMARLLNAQSRFGAELDSLSDVISFGIAPALVVYLWSTHSLGSVGWAASLLFAVCAALRLARFNSALDLEVPSYAKTFFTGVPAPAGAGLALVPLMASLAAGPGWVDHPVFAALWIAVVGGLMISRLPTFSLKGLKVAPVMVAPVLLLVGLIAVALASTPWQTLALVGVLYLVSLPFAWLRHRRLARQYEDTAPPDATPDGIGTDVDPPRVHPAGDAVAGPGTAALPGRTPDPPETR